MECDFKSAMRVERILGGLSARQVLDLELSQTDEKAFALVERIQVGNRAQQSVSSDVIVADQAVYGLVAQHAARLGEFRVGVLAKKAKNQGAGSLTCSTTILFSV